MSSEDGLENGPGVVRDGEQDNEGRGDEDGARQEGPAFDMSDVGIPSSEGIPGEDKGDGEENEQEEEEEEDAAEQEPAMIILTEGEIKARLEESEALKVQGNALFRSGAYEEAKGAYDEAIDNCEGVTDRKVAAYFFNRGACHFKLEDWQACVDDCSSATSLAPPYPKAMLKKAQALEKLEDLEAALEAYEELVKVDPRNQAALSAIMRLPAEIKAKQEKMKEEMFGKLKELGNMCLKPFGLSTENFQMVQDPSSGSYSINFVQNGGNNSSSSQTTSSSSQQ